MMSVDEGSPLLGRSSRSDGILRVTKLKALGIVEAARTIPAIPAILVANSILAASSTPLFTLGFQRVYLDIICCRQLQDPESCHDERVCKEVDGVPAQLSQIIGNMASSQAAFALLGLGLWFYVWKAISNCLNLDRKWPLFASLGGELATEAMKVVTLHLILAYGLSLDWVLVVPVLYLVAGGGVAMHMALRNAVVTEGRGAQERAYRERMVTFILLDILPLISRTVADFVVGAMKDWYDPWKSLYAGLGIYSLAVMVLFLLPKAPAQPSGGNDGQGSNDDTRDNDTHDNGNYDNGDDDDENDNDDDDYDTNSQNDDNNNDDGNQDNQDNGKDNGNNWLNNTKKYSILLFATSVLGVLGYSIMVFSPQYILNRYSTRISDAALMLGAGDIAAGIMLIGIAWLPQQHWRGFRIDLLLLIICFVFATLASTIMGLSSSLVLFSFSMAVAFGSTMSIALVYSYFAATSTNEMHAKFFTLDQVFQAVSRFLGAKGLDWLLRQGIACGFLGLPYVVVAGLCFLSLVALVWRLFNDRASRR